MCLDSANVDHCPQCYDCDDCATLCTDCGKCPDCTEKPFCDACGECSTCLGNVDFSGCGIHVYCSDCYDICEVCHLCDDCVDICPACGLCDSENCGGWSSLCSNSECGKCNLCSAQCACGSGKCTACCAKVDITQTEEIKGIAGSSGTLTLTSDSFSSGGYMWTCPAGLSGSGSGTTFTYNPSASTPGTYTVTCKSANCSVTTDSCTVHIVKVIFDIDPVDNIIRGATPVPVTVTVTPATLAGSVSFQVNNGNVTVQGTAPNITVTGVSVGASTIKAKVSGAEFGSFGASVIANSGFSASDANVVDGATPMTPLPGYGLTKEEKVTVEITAGRDGRQWRAIMISATGHYSIQTSLCNLNEVTGPEAGGNTTQSNHGDQISDLGFDNPNDAIFWYMESAIEAHEEVHAGHLIDSFQDEGFMEYLENKVEDITSEATDQESAINEILGSQALGLELAGAKNIWYNLTTPLIFFDHTDGSCDTAMRAVLDVMITTITNYAIGHGW